MQVTIPPDVEPLLRKRLESGAFESAEDVVRRALEVLDAEETWTDDERRALDAKIDAALQQVAQGRTVSPDEAKRKLAEMRATHLANRNP